MKKYKWKVRFSPNHGDLIEEEVITNTLNVNDALLKWQVGKNLCFIGIETVEIVWVYKDQIQDIEDQLDESCLNPEETEQFHHICQSDGITREEALEVVLRRRSTEYEKER